jgi:expansin (peptidoglycan-binding protein)
MLLFDGFLGYGGGDPNSNPICGRKVAANYQGKTVEVTITDRCVGCQKFDLDFSPSAFDKLGAESEGRLHGMKWHFI